MIRVGNIEDGGWDICNDERFRPRSPCIVYSIGINYDFSFDDAIERIFRCDVFSFDPSMDIGDQNRSNHIKFYKLGIGDKNEEVIFRGKVWKLKTLKEIQEMLGHTNKRIDILKMDIENNEFQTLPDMIRSGAMKNVAQFCVEFHHYYDIQTIRELHNLGFRIYWSHQNPFAEVYKNDQSYSFGNDVHFVNINMVN
ncbi:hypothetical protein FSP39_018023 [Pinctada imbricata]|uniref:Methyltransferase domain-containing protein n=1 Tax=Pinctada imbricata TaxID=66713 RepID=A0AA88YP59_PINIB|nr:hypothetical protein FSP39_018023 [Pinctada imbricata]